jgi:hypothetical protein
MQSDQLNGESSSRCLAERQLEEAAPQMAQKNINLKILSGLTIPVPLFIESNATHA